MTYFGGERQGEVQRLPSAAATNANVFSLGVTCSETPNIVVRFLYSLHLTLAMSIHGFTVP